MSDLPASTRLAWWGTAWLRGSVVTDLMLDALIGDDATHTVAGLAAALDGTGPGAGLGTTERADTLLIAMARLRSQGVTSMGAAYPTYGDPCGLGGPAPFNAAALEAGQAVVATGAGAGLGLVPGRVGAVVVWQVFAAARRQVPDVGEADRGLREALPRAAEALARLDVARWRPEVADALMNLRRRDPLSGPDGVPPLCLTLAARAMQAMDIVELALADEGGSVTAAEAEARRSALDGLDRAARRGLVAASSPEAWPPPPGRTMA